MNAVNCPFGSSKHNYTTVVTTHYTIPGIANTMLERTAAYVVCTKCGDAVKLGDDEL